MSAALTGTWHKNTYPGCGCDMPSSLYSLSFDKNPNWSKAYSGQEEIRTYLEAVAKKHDVYKHVHFQHKGVAAKWIAGDKVWEIQILDLQTKKTFTKRASIFVSAVGGLDTPAYPDIPGLKEFPGDLWHSSNWNHQVNLTGKRVAVLGNGCSAVQFLPFITKQTAQLYHYVHTPHWILPKVNDKVSSWWKWMLNWIPGFNWLCRALLFLQFDPRYHLFIKANGPVRPALEKQSTEYIEKTAPKKYHDFLIPKFPLGCKRIILDEGYLAITNEPNYHLISDHIASIDGNSITTKDGTRHEVDVIICATGFKVQDDPRGVEIYGEHGEELGARWKRQGGMRAYKGTVVSKFPNYFILLGPNTSNGHNSVIFSIECQVEYMVKLLKPIFRGEISAVAPKEDAEEIYNEKIQKKLQNTVWNSDGCTSFYKNKAGKITVTYPGTMTAFWWETLWPTWKDFELVKAKSD